VEKVMIEADTSSLPTQTQFNTHMYESVQQKAKDNFDDIMKICNDSGIRMKSVPQVIVDGKFIGGYEEIEAWCKTTFEE
jgi:glutaredoxin